MDTLKVIVQFIAQNAIWIGMIILFPVWVDIGKLLRFWIQELIRPKKKIIIRHLNNKQLKNKVELDFESDEPLVDQIERIREAQR